MKNPDKYRNFGFRLSFYEHFLDNGTDCFTMNILGKDQYTSLKRWLAESGMLKMEVKETSGKINERILNETTPLADHVIKMGAYNPFAWAVMWANLAHNSIIVKHFCLNIAPGDMYDNNYLIESLGNDIDLKYRKQAVNSLLSTFRDSPIGASLKQGIQIEKSYLREGWEYPHAVALLYSLYLYAEHVGRKSFTFTELLNAHLYPDSQGISPHDIFGIDAKAFREQVQGLAVTYPKYIRVSFIGNLDNIILENFSSDDILDLAQDD